MQPSGHPLEPIHPLAQVGPELAVVGRGQLDPQAVELLVQGDPQLDNFIVEKIQAAHTGKVISK